MICGEQNYNSVKKYDGIFHHQFREKPGATIIYHDYDQSKH